MDKDTNNSKNSLTIRFGDYFSVSVPKYRKFSELRREEAVYLSQSTLLHKDLYKFINNKRCFAFPEDLVRNVLVVELQKYNSLIELDGGMFDWSCSYSEYSPRDEEDFDLYCFDKKLSAVNNIFFEDKIDIEATLLNSLLEIKAKTAEISIEYIRSFFGYVEYCSQNHKCDNCIHNKGEECELTPLGVKAIDDAGEKSSRIIFSETGDERFIILPDVLENMIIEIDNSAAQSDLVYQYNQYLFEQSRALGKNELHERFGYPLYESLISLEGRIYSHLTQYEKLNDKDSYTGFVRLLEDAIVIYNSIRSNIQNNTQGISRSSMMSFVTACEIILKTKLRLLNLSKWDSTNDFRKNIDFIFNYEKDIFNRRLSFEERNEFRNCLHEIRKWKNKGSHTSEFLSIEEADQLIEKACNKFIRRVIDYIR